MKRVTIPKPQTVIGSVVKDGGKPEPMVIELTLPDLLENQVWGLPYWRTGSSDLLHVVIRLAPAFKDQKEGAEIDISDFDHEHVVKAAMMGDKVMSGASVVQILTLLCALTAAKDV